MSHAQLTDIIGPASAFSGLPENSGAGFALISEYPYILAVHTKFYILSNPREPIPRDLSLSGFEVSNDDSGK